MFYIFPAYAQLKTSFNLQQGDEINILSQKKNIYEEKGHKIIEATGEVVIVHGPETLYGQIATFNTGTGQFEIEGDVRFIGPDLTLYGSRISYNAQSKYMKVTDARMFTDSFNVVAKEIEKIDEGRYIGEQAEFSTCKDCPESWSVYGAKIDLTVNKYVHIKNALIKIAGADLVYVPYLIFPVKSQRETGLLFPLITSRRIEGPAYQQPFFWAIDEHKDMTLSPVVSDKRGLGIDLEYRQEISDQTWVEANTMTRRDALYQPNNLQDRESGQFLRYFNNFEGHSRPSINWNLYFSHQGSRDLDYLQDYPIIINPFITGTELGSRFFVNGRTDKWDFGLEATLFNNMLVQDARSPESFFSVDPDYVQKLPRFHLSLTPQQIYKTSGNWLNQLTFHFDGEFANFQQSHRDPEAEQTTIRNTQRLNIHPTLKLGVFDNGLFQLTSSYTFDHQVYRFSDSQLRDGEKFHRNAQKYSGQLISEFSFEIEKVYGVATTEEVISDVDSQLEKTPLDENLIGKVPRFSDQAIGKKEVITKSSYKHNQTYKLVHYYSPGEREFGNSVFLSQIDRAQGWFDYHDAIRSQEARQGENDTRTQIIRDNTVELQWNHSLIRKTPKSYDFNQDYRYLQDNFSYNQIAFFNVSQGIVLNEDGNVNNQLSRLAMQFGVNAHRYFQFRTSHIYFHQSSRSILNVNIRNDFDFIQFSNSIIYNELNNRKIHTYGIQLPVFDELTIMTMTTRDMDINQVLFQHYYVNYIPKNDCWLVSLAYGRQLDNHRVSVDLQFNFGSDTFGNNLFRLF